MTPESFTALRQRLEKNGGSVGLPRGNPVHTPYPEMPGKKWEPKGIKKNAAITSKNLVTGPCATEPEQAPGHRALGAGEVQTESTARRLISFISYRTRLLDDDNNCFKYECDALRYCGVIKDDSRGHVRIVTDQVKVHSKEEIGTEIKITSI